MACWNFSFSNFANRLLWYYRIYIRTNNLSSSASSTLPTVTTPTFARRSKLKNLVLCGIVTTLCYILFTITVGYQINARATENYKVSYQATFPQSGLTILLVVVEH